MITLQALTEAENKVKEFARNNPGRTNGEDFPEFAKVVLESKRFEAATLVSFMLTVMSQPPKDEGDGKDILKYILSSPLAKSSIELMYVAYQLGKQVAEIEVLQRIAK